MDNEEKVVVQDEFAPETADKKPVKAKTKKKKKKRNTEARTIHLKKSAGTASLYDWIHSLVFAVAVVVILLTFFLRLVDVSGTSMVPTLLHQDKVIVTNFWYNPQDGDIVVISHGAEYSDPIIKRVIATEGQKLDIDFESGEVKVDGELLDEPYIQGFTHAEDGEIPEVVPEGKIFVMGDNRGVSLDSRSKEIGLIDKDDVIGKAQLVVFPFNSIKYLY